METELEELSQIEVFVRPPEAVDAEKVIKKSKVLAAEIAKTRAELKKKVDELESEREGLKDVAREMTKKLFVEDKRNMRELLVGIEKMDELQHVSVNEIEKIFKAVFSRGPSKTYEVAGKKQERVSRWSSEGSMKTTIVYGKFGFGMRYNKASRAAERSDQVWAILKRKEEVLDGLKDAKLMEVYQKFKRFTELVPQELLEHDGSFSITVPLQEVVEIESYGESGTKLHIGFEQAYRGKRYFRVVSEDGGSGSTIGFDDSTDEMMYLQVRGELIRRNAEFTARVNSIVQKLESVVSSLKSAFARELMLAEL